MRLPSLGRQGRSSLSAAVRRIFSVREFRRATMQNAIVWNGRIDGRSMKQFLFYISAQSAPRWHGKNEKPIGAKNKVLAGLPSRSREVSRGKSRGRLFIVAAAKAKEGGKKTSLRMHAFFCQVDVCCRAQGGRMLAGRKKREPEFLIVSAQLLETRQFPRLRTTSLKINRAVDITMARTALFSVVLSKNASMEEEKLVSRARRGSQLLVEPRRRKEREKVAESAIASRPASIVTRTGGRVRAYTRALTAALRQYRITGEAVSRAVRIIYAQRRHETSRSAGMLQRRDAAARPNAFNVMDTSCGAGSGH